MAEEEQQDFSKLSLEDRCQHKNWKARVSAYEELGKIFQRIDDDKSPEWMKYAAWVRKFPLDSNAAAQEKALEVALLFLENSGLGPAGRIVAELMSGVVAKCVTAPKAKSKELAMSITLMCVEIEKFEAVQEELMKGIEHKNPKVVGGCINIMTEVLRAFGPKVVNLKTILKKVPVLTEDRDKSVRDETKKLMVELYRWLGAAFKLQLSAVKPLVVQDVEQEVEKLAGEKPKQTRYLRSQQAKQERIAAAEEGEDADGDEEAVVEDAAPDIDPYDLLDPVDILAKLPKDFYEKCEAKKWQDRKEAMEALEVLLQNPKLEPGDYADLVRMLKRIVGKDNNVVVVALAGKCIAGLANGLKKKFSPYAPSCISTILEKFKEKKTNVVVAMKEAIDASFASTTLEAIQEDTVLALQNKNPAVKLETNAFLARAFSKTSFKIMSDKKLMKPYFTAIVANLNEPDPAVRDAAAEAFGVAFKHLGEKTLGPLIADMEPIKLQKVKECAEKAVITAPKEKGTKPPPKPAVAGSVKPKAVVRPGQKPAADKKPAAPAKKVTNGSKAKSKPEPDSDEEFSTDAATTPDEPTDDDGFTRVDISSQITESLLKELADKNWKTRDAAIDKISAIIATSKHLKSDLGDLPQALSHRLQDSNKNLATNTFLVCQNLAVALGPNCKPHISTLAASMLSGLSDNKIGVRATVVACINAWADNGGVQEFFLGGFIPDALKNGNPFLRTELFNWLAIRLPTMKTVNKDELNACVAHLLANVEDRNPECRKSAQDAILPFMIHIGYDGMTRHASRLKPTSKTAVQALLDKARPNLPAKPAAPSAGGAKKAATGKAVQSRSGSNLSKNPDTLVLETKSSGSSKIGRAAHNAKGSPPSKKATEEQIGAILQTNNLKAQRISDEMKLKILKWNFTIPRDEFIDLLKELMTTAGVGKTLMANMFHTDFKMHLKALDTLQEEFSQGCEGTMSNLDLILKWSTLRFYDTNPSVLIRILDYLSQVFLVLGDQGYNMADVEGNAFIPYLLLKIGDPKDLVRSNVHQILRLLVNVYSPQRIFSFVMEGLKSKNARQRSECLDELANMIATHGMSIIHPSPSAALKEIAKQIADRDNAVRNSALNAAVQAYYIEGDKIYKLIGQLSDKDQSLLDERIKRAAKTRPVAPPPVNLTARVVPAAVAVPSYSVPVISPTRPQVPMYNANILQTQNLNTTSTLPMREDVIENRHSTFVGEPHRSTTLPEKYRIDFEAIDNMFNDIEPIPALELLDTNLEQFMRGETITLPKRRMGGVVPSSVQKDQAATNVEPPQANQSIDLCVAQISDPILRKSMEACIKLEKMLLDPETSSIMSGRVDTMLAMVALQMRRQQPTLLSSNDERLVELNKFFRTSVGLLTVLFKGDFLPKRASKDSLKDIIYHLLVLIIDEHLEMLSDAPTIIKLINVMVVRIIEKADPNAISCALIGLLNETLASTTLIQTRLLELVMKCQWKLLKQYNIWLEKKEYEWDLGGILSEFAAFMRAHPFNSFQNRDVTPLKTIKTILHALVLQVGSESINYQLNLMPDLRDSEAGKYLTKLIQREQAKTSKNLVATNVDSTLIR